MVKSQLLLYNDTRVSAAGQFQQQASYSKPVSTAGQLQQQVSSTQHAVCACCVSESEKTILRWKHKV